MPITPEPLPARPIFFDRVLDDLVSRWARLVRSSQNLDDEGKAIFDDRSQLFGADLNNAVARYNELEAWYLARSN